MSGRVLLDGEGDSWYEIRPGRFYYGFSFEDAEDRVSFSETRTEDEIRLWFGGITDVTP